MENAVIVAMFTVLVGLSWRLERKIDKASADHRTELRTTRTELTDRIDKTETRLRGEIDKTETRLRGEIRVVGENVEILEKRIGHYEQRISYVEGKLDLGFGAPRQDNSTAA